MRDSYGRTPMHYAARDGDIKAIRELLKEGRRDDTDYMGRTPLHYAAQEGKTEAIRELLKVGAYFSKNKDGNTPLHWAAQGGHKEAIGELLRAGANLEVTGFQDYTPLHQAVYSGKVEGIDALLKAGAHLEAKASEGRTPLHLAAQGGSKEVIDVLLRAGANLDTTTKDGRTPLYMAVGHGVVEYFVKAGAKLEGRDKEGETLLHMAVKYCKIEEIDVLVKAGAKLEVTNQYGYTPLHVAVLNCCKIEVVELLVRAGAKVDTKDSQGSTPLHCAVWRDNVKAVSILLKKMTSTVILEDIIKVTSNFIPINKEEIKSLIEQRITELKNPLTSFTTKVDRTLDHNSTVPIKSTSSKDLKSEQTTETSSMPASHSAPAPQDISGGATNSSSVSSYNTGAPSTMFLIPCDDEKDDSSSMGKAAFLISSEHQENATASSSSLNIGAFLIATEADGTGASAVAQMQEINASAHLLDYYEGFTNLFSQALSIAKAAINGTLVADRANLEKTITAKTLSLIPFCATAPGSTVEDIAVFVLSVKFQRLAKKFEKLAQDSGSFDEMVHQIAREVVLHPKIKAILGEGREEEALSGWLGNLTQQCRKFGVELNKKIFGETYESDAAKLGYKDACKLINMWVSGKIEIEDGMRIEESFVKAALEPAAIGSDKQCLVMMVTEIKYGNPLLNHPNPSFLKQLSEACGHDMVTLLMDLCGNNSKMDNIQQNYGHNAEPLYILGDEYVYAF